VAGLGTNSLLEIHKCRLNERSLPSVSSEEEKEAGFIKLKIIALMCAVKLQMN